MESVTSGLAKKQEHLLKLKTIIANKKDRERICFPAAILPFFHFFYERVSLSCMD